MSCHIIFIEAHYELRKTLLSLQFVLCTGYSEVNQGVCKHFTVTQTNVECRHLLTPKMSKHFQSAAFMRLANCHIIAATLDILATNRHLNVLLVLETNTEILNKN